MRIFKVGTIALRKTDSCRDVTHNVKNREERFQEAEPFINKAGQEHVDFLCLPEIFSTAGVEARKEKEPEPFPGGPTADFCGRMARKNNLNLITTIDRIKGDKIFNTAVIFGRNGEVAGLYDKVHPAPGEPVSAGSEFPVHDVEGLKIGMQICYDFNFPEGCRILALKGADIIFWPTMWDGPMDHFTDCIMRARAMENVLAVVSSGYVFYGTGSWDVVKSITPTAIVSWNGYIVAQAGLNTGLACAEIDFDEVKNLQASKEELFRSRRPELYQELSRLQTEKK